jgi:multidrug efflux pump subunit AcrA (membrane-fusion protein)
MKRGKLAIGRITGFALFFILITIGSILVTGCAARSPDSGTNVTQSQGKSGADEEEAIFAVSTTKVVRGQVNDYIELTGDVETESNIDVYPDTFGKLTKVLVNVGQRVAKNQVLAEVDPSKPGSYFVASPVKAPIEGTITSLPLAIGTTISQGMSIAKIITLDQLQIKTFVAERFIADMHIGQEAFISFMAYPDVRFPAVVTELNPVVDPATRTMDVKLKLTTPDARIKAGMFGRIKIITHPKSDVIKIPVECVVNRFGDNYVFVLGEKQQDKKDVYHVKRRVITAGIRIDDILEVTKGLNAGETIVSEGQTLLDDDSLVKVVKEQPPLPVKHEIQ